MRHHFSYLAALLWLLVLALPLDAVAQTAIPRHSSNHQDHRHRHLTGTGGMHTVTQRETIRIMTYNIYHGEGIDGQHDYGRVADIIRREQADIVAVQEVDSVTRRSHGADVLQQIADSAGMTCTFVPTLDYEGGAYGIGLLSKKKPRRVLTYALPGREEPRALLVVEFADYVVACTHLSLTAEDQWASVDSIRAVAEQSHKPFFLAGDWNAEPADSTIAAVQRCFTLAGDLSVPTYPADKPTQRLDYIGVWTGNSDRVTLKESHVVDERVASDHRPVVATYQLTTVRRRHC